MTRKERRQQYPFFLHFIDAHDSKFWGGGVLEGSSDFCKNHWKELMLFGQNFRNGFVIFGFTTLLLKSFS